MKRLWLAGGIFIVIITLCLSSLLYQRRQTEVLLNDLDDVIAAHEDGDSARAYELAMALEKNYRRYVRVLSCFMAHGDLIECHQSLALLPSILKDGEAEEFHMESTRCRIQLQRLASSELPTPENIL